MLLGQAFFDSIVFVSFSEGFLMSGASFVAALTCRFYNIGWAKVAGHLADNPKAPT